MSNNRPHSETLWKTIAAVMAIALAGSWGYLFPRVHSTSVDTRASAQNVKEPARTAVVSEEILTRSTKFIGAYEGSSVRPVEAAGTVTFVPAEEKSPVVVELSGRPVIAADLRFSLYRDIAQGDSGRDVAQFREVLGKLGFPCPSKTPEVFSKKLSKCISKAYKTWGYAPPLRPQPPAPNGEPRRTPKPAAPKANPSNAAPKANPSNTDSRPEGTKNEKPATEAEPQRPPTVLAAYVAKSEWIQVKPGESLSREGLTVGSLLGQDKKLTVKSAAPKVIVKDQGSLAKQGLASAPIELTPFAEPDKKIEAKIARIEATPEASVIHLEAEPPIATGEVNGRIVAESTKSKVRILPLEAVRFDVGGKRYVNLQTTLDSGEKKVTKVPVTTGLEANGMVHLTDGPAVGSVIIVGDHHG